MQFTGIDIAIGLFILIYALAATGRGFIVVTLGLIRFVVALAVALLLVAPATALVIDQTGWPVVWAQPAIFITLWALVDVLLGRVVDGMARGLGYGTHASPVNRALAVLPGALQGLIVATALLTVAALLPIAEPIRREIGRSTVGSRLVQAADVATEPLAEVFEPALREAEGFVTLRPPAAPGDTGQERVDLPFQVQDAPALPAVEEEMLALVNRERAEQGLGPLTMDPELQAVARAHADDMLRRGYFAHLSPEGATPFDRIRAAGITFRQAGENLAFAPNVSVAHRGLMNSPGHRANILQPGFGRAGIGVLDAGLRGQMFVQLFRD